MKECNKREREFLPARAPALDARDDAIQMRLVGSVEILPPRHGD